MRQFNHFFSSLAFILITGCAQQSTPKHLAIQNPPDLYAAIDKATETGIGDNATRNAIESTVNHPSIETSSQSQTIWQRMKTLYALPEIQHDRIERHVNWYLNHPEYLSRIQTRATPYLHFILDEIEKQGIPGEIALLPAVESAFKPEAYSPSHASGLWQFIPSTGRYFGLKQTPWYDGRRDVVASTQAAVSYLKQLSEEFEGNWLLALASYNAGKGNIRKAIRKNRKKGQKTDYWSLRLRRETMNYVPRLLAIAKIFSDPERYHLALNDIPNKPHFEIITLDSQIDIKKAAELAQLPVDDFLKLNPAFNRWMTSPNGPHRLLVPKDKAAIFKKNLAKLPKTERVEWRHHTVKKGESLNLIARKYRVSIASIKSRNHLHSNRIKTGNQLLIPLSDRPRLVAGSQNMQHYTVKRGDSIWKIARRFSVSQRNLVRWNRLSFKKPLRLGQRLLIKRPLTLTSRSNRNIHYTVKKGDSLFLISKKFNVSVSDLKKWNRQTINDFLQPGQTLKIVVDLKPST